MPYDVAKLVVPNAGLTISDMGSSLLVSSQIRKREQFNDFFFPFKLKVFALKTCSLLSDYSPCAFFFFFDGKISDETLVK